LAIARAEANVKCGVACVQEPLARGIQPHIVKASNEMPLAMSSQFHRHRTGKSDRAHGGDRTAGLVTSAVAAIVVEIRPLGLASDELVM
jgi:hypothetical protein